MSPRDILVHLMEKVSSTLMKGQTGGLTKGWIRNQSDQHGRKLERVGTGNPEAKLPTSHHDQPRANSRINDSYCVNKLQARLLARSIPPRQTIDTFVNSNVNLPL